MLQSSPGDSAAQIKRVTAGQQKKLNLLGVWGVELMMWVMEQTLLSGVQVTADKCEDILYNFHTWLQFN